GPAPAARGRISMRRNEEGAGAVGCGAGTTVVGVSGVAGGAGRWAGLRGWLTGGRRVTGGGAAGCGAGKPLQTAKCKMQSANWKSVARRAPYARRLRESARGRSGIEYCFRDEIRPASLPEKCARDPRDLRLKEPHSRGNSAAKNVADYKNGARQRSI